MNFQFYLEKLGNSEMFKKFGLENPSAFLCSCFFAIDKEGKDNQQHFDFCVRENSLASRDIDGSESASPDSSREKIVNEKNSSPTGETIGKNKINSSKIASFQMENDCKVMMSDMIGEQKFEKISEDLDFDFEKVEELIEKKAEKEGIKNKIQKYLLSLQNVDGKNFLVGTVFISGLGMIKVQIDLKKMKLVEFEKKSMFDMINVFKKKESQ